jgi:hypothetical protein
MECDTCGNKFAYRIRTKFFDNKIISCCDSCGNLDQVHVADVYFKEPYYDENIVDDKISSTWTKGTFVTSRSHKAELMKKYYLYESGDKIHGARNFEKRRTHVIY